MANIEQQIQALTALVNIIVQAGALGLAIVMAFVLIIDRRARNASDKHNQAMEERHDAREVESNKIRGEHTIELRTLSTAQMQLGEVLKLVGQTLATSTETLLGQINLNTQRVETVGSHVSNIHGVLSGTVSKMEERVRKSDELFAEQRQTLDEIMGAITELPNTIRPVWQKDLQPVAEQIAGLVTGINTLKTNLGEAHKALLDQVTLDLKAVGEAYQNATSVIGDAQATLAKDLSHALEYLARVEKVAASLADNAVQLVNLQTKSATAADAPSRPVLPPGTIAPSAKPAAAAGGA